MWKTKTGKGIFHLCGSLNYKRMGTSQTAKSLENLTGRDGRRGGGNGTHSLLGGTGEGVHGSPSGGFPGGSALPSPPLRLRSPIREETLE